ncbi:peptidylprolyl isomerase [Aegicerativicinus sediminis]|uniref:peptidylprolyl isomerase n=1 Tax=Aegicerativicinus sediminis TaxID=2893202 RepID=UPI001E355428|nr:peptidylprolyl isomerase [Aegicerativicinus sediminis]
MAVLNKIRQRSLFLILVIALALFSFVLADLFKNSSALTGGSQDVVATVNGEDINRTTFADRVELMQRQMGPASTSTQAMDRVYNQQVKEVLIEQQLQELGYTVEQAETRELLRNAFASYPEFTNEAGMFDEAKLNEYIANLKAIAPQPAPLGNFQMTYADWVNYEATLGRNAQEQAYYNMIKAGLNATLGEAEDEYMLESNTVDVRFVQLPFTSIADSLVEVTKSDIKNYIDKNPDQYQVEDSRDIVFVEFTEQPTVEDEEAVKENLLALLQNRVEYNKETKTNDSVYGFRDLTADKIGEFVNSNSDIRYSDNFIFKNALPLNYRDSIYDLNVGDIFGPYKDAGYYKLSKVVAEKQIPDSVKSRHILIPYIGAQMAQPDVIRTPDQAKQLADSLYNVLQKNKSKFGEFVTEYSSDQGSVNNGGEYDFHSFGTMVKPFNDFEFENAPGSMKVVETVFGYHIVEVLEQSSKKRAIKVATIAEKIEPSENTIDEVFNETSKFEIAIKEKAFRDVAKENGYNVRPVNNIKELQEMLPGLGNQRTIVRWAFEDETDLGEFKRFSLAGGGYVVVQLVGKHKAGLMDPENASATAIAEIRNQKKAEMLKSKVSATSLDDIAKNNNTSVRTAAAVNMKNPTLAGAGLEPKVVGVAFGLKEGEISDLVVGNKGVYKIEVTKKTDAAKLDNYQGVLSRLNSSAGANVQTKVFDALKNAAEIDDYRGRFY